MGKQGYTLDNVDKVCLATVHQRQPISSYC